MWQGTPNVGVSVLVYLAQNVGFSWYVLIILFLSHSIPQSSLILPAHVEKKISFISPNNGVRLVISWSQKCWGSNLLINTLT